MIRLLFLGSDTFPTPILKKLIGSKNIEVVGIITAPFVTDDKEDIYYLARKEKVKTFQPHKLREDQEEILKQTSPDIIVVCNYGQILEKTLIDYPRYKTLNIHFSLLPELRGACPIEMAIIKGLEKTGITIQIMEEGLDSGDIIYQEEIPLPSKETGGSLGEKLRQLSSLCIETVVLDWIEGKLKPHSQDNSKATFCFRKDISKNAAQILWDEPAQLIERKIRAFNPRPTAWTYLVDGKVTKRLKVFAANYDSKDITSDSRDIAIKDGNLIIQTAKGTISPTEIQLEGKKIMNVVDFLRGYKGEIKVL